MGILDHLRKDQNLVKKSKNMSLEDLFNGIEVESETELEDDFLLNIEEASTETNVLEDEKNIFKGSSLNKILKKIANEYSVHQKLIKYNVLERPKRNILGLAKGLFIVEITNLDEISALGDFGGVEKDYFDVKDLEKIKRETLYDTGVEIFITPSKGVFLRRVGSKVDEARAISYVKTRYSGFFDSRMLYSFLQSEAKEIHLAQYGGDIGNDYGISISMGDEDATAYIELSAPKLDGADVELGDISAFLKEKGIKEEFFKMGAIKELEEKRIYGVKALVAEGQKAIHGRNAEIIFDVDMKEGVDFENDRIDFKTLNPVINVEKDQLIAHKGEAVEGVDGVSVYGAKIAARQSSDVSMDALTGTNTELRDDGRSLYALESGQLIKGKKGEFSIREVMVVDGDVGPKTGNIEFIGSVEVKGSILAGYSVKVGGNLSVNDSVETCNVEVVGTLIVKLGINGKGEGIIHCGNLYSKFIQDAEAHVLEGVYVEEGIIRSKIYSNGCVVVNGKRANIISSTVYAKDEINAKSIGSQNESKVSVKVGYPGIARLEYENISEEMSSLTTEVAKVIVEIDSIEKKGPAYVKKFQEKYDAFIEERAEKEPKLAEYEAKKQEIGNYLKTNKNAEGFIAVSDTIYVGTSVTCCDAEFDIKIEDRALKYTVNKENPKFIFIARNIGDRSKKRGEK